MKKGPEQMLSSLYSYVMRIFQNSYSRLAQMDQPHQLRERETNQSDGRQNRPKLVSYWFTTKTSLGGSFILSGTQNFTNFKFSCEFTDTYKNVLLQMGLISDFDIKSNFKFSC